MTEQIIALISSPTVTSLVWILFFILILWMFKKDIKNLLNKTTNVQIGSFALKVTQEGEKIGINTILGDLRGLSYETLKAFLIMCGENAKFYEFVDRSMINEKVEDIYTSLRSKGLIEFEKIGKDLKITTTDKGKAIHRAIIDSLYFELRK